MTGYIPLRRIARLCYGESLPSEDRVDGDVPVVGSGGISGVHSAYNVEAPGIIVGRKGSYGSVHWVPDRSFAIDTAYYIDHRSTSVDMRWLYYALQAVDLKGASQDVGVPGLSREAAYAVAVPSPPNGNEQRRIADFLDVETSRIDSLVDMRNAQLRLAVEREMSRVYSTITGGGLPGAKCDSGVAWIGRIPTGWPMAKVSVHFEVLLGKMLNQERVIGDYLAPYLRNVNVQWDSIDTSDLLYMDFPPNERSRYNILPGDLLICEGGEPGRSAIWHGSIHDIYYQKALHRARSWGKSSVRWLYYCLRAATWLNVFAVEGNSTTIAHLTGEQLRAHKFPFPDRGVQDALVSELDEAAGRARDIETAVNEQQRLLGERRQALITAAVTGQVDVTTATGIEAS